jgi:NAD-dependent dihydropyrimidine dehydrogenase PreA subunit
MALLVCSCSHRDIIPASALAGATEDACTVVVKDLCALVQEGGMGLAEFAQAGGRVAACHPRAVRALFGAVGVDFPEDRVVDLRAGASLPDNRGDTVPCPPLGSAPDEDAWFPAIDRERCTNCGRCADFCLFGVYRKTEQGRIEVACPVRCKLDCPACARICPENAIVFAKSPDEAINGARLSPEELANARIRLSPDELAGGNLHAKLAARSARRRLLKPDALGEDS